MMTRGGTSNAKPNMTWSQFVLGVILNILAVLSVGWGAATWVGKAEVREWMRTEGEPKVQLMIDHDITLHEARQALAIAAAKLQLSNELSTKLDQAAQLASTNAALLGDNQKLLEKLEKRLDYLYARAGGR